MTKPCISIIVCTYRRPECLGRLLDSLAVQDRRDFEVIIVDASESLREAEKLAAQFESPTDKGIAISVMASARSLPRQRNAGLARARGDLLCFLDDDVTVEETFVSCICGALEQPAMADVGGLTGYDELHYGVAPSIRYRIRRALGFHKNLLPGSIGMCEATVPLSFQAPFAGSIDVGWLPGFCMIYRRDAIEHLRFDEGLTAYGAEDALFSMEAGRKRRLSMLGDLRVKHHSTPVSRVPDVEAVYGASFALARNYFARRAGARAFATISWYAAVEVCLDALSALHRPSLGRVRAAWARLAGLLEGIRSVRSPQRLADSGSRS